MSYIVTGGAGFIGSNMVRKLNDEGISDVIIIDNYDEAKMPNLLGLQFKDFIDYSDGIAAIAKKLNEIGGQAEGVFHIGANADVLESNPKVMMTMNYEFSKLYYNFASENNIPFIYASSSAVYGNKKHQYGRLDDLKPHNIYAWSKWLFDKYIEARMKEARSKVIGFRFFNVFGTGEAHKGKNANIVFRFYKMMKEDGQIDLFKDEIVRDHVFVEDVVEVMYRAMDSKETESGIYNLGGNHPISHKRVAEIVVETMMGENAIPKKSAEEYIHYIDMPKELRSKFQFHTFAEGQLKWISEVTEGNEEKMKLYVSKLIKTGL